MQVGFAHMAYQRLVASRWEAYFVAAWSHTASKPEKRGKRANTFNDWFTAHRGNPKEVVPALWQRAQDLIKASG